MWDVEPAAPEIVLLPKKFPWTKELADQAMALWNEGKSATQIAIILGGGAAVASAGGRARVQGGGLTRNAVMGKIHRLGLNRNGKAPTPGNWFKQPSPLREAKQRYKAKRRQPWADVFDLADELVPTAVALLELERHHCRWPVNGAGADMLYCGGAAIKGFPYCNRHCCIAYRPRGAA